VNVCPAIVSVPPVTTTRNPVMAQLIGGEDRISGSRVEATLAIGGVDVPVIVTPLVHRGAGVVRGDARHQLAGVPATSVLLERVAEYERAGEPLDRLFRVYLWSARSTPDSLAVTLRIPAGLVADSLTRTVTLPAFGTRNVFFRIHGTPRAGSDTIAATARSIVSTGDRPNTVPCPASSTATFSPSTPTTITSQRSSVTSPPRRRSA